MKDKPVEIPIDLENGEEKGHRAVDEQNLSKSLQNFGENWTRLNFSAASALILTYILEISIQIYFLTRYFDVKSENGQILCLGLFLTSIFVTFLSLFWVFRGLDFAGRFCARLVCYLIHSLLLGLIWRYLKLAFAYDHADLQEFFSLRFFQLFTQSIPLLSLQLAVIFTLPQSGVQIYFGLFLSILSICISLNILQNLKNSEKKSTLLMVNKDLNKNIENSSHFNTNLNKFLKFLCSTILLTSRICVISLIIWTIGNFGHFWTILFVIVHCTVCFLWISFCDKMYENSTCSSNNFENFKLVEFLYSVSQKVFIFFFDITHDFDGRNVNKWSASLPIGLVVIENFTIYIYYTVLYTNFYSIFGLTIFTIGLILFGFLIFVQNHNWNKIFEQISSNLCNVEKKCALEDKVIGDLIEKGEVLNGKSAWDLTMKRAIIKPNNYTNISEVLRAKLGKKDLPEMKNLDGSSDPLEQIKIIEQAPKSPSDTCSSKNSSNDRNTNTLDSSTTDHNRNRQFLNLIQTHTNTNTNNKTNQNQDLDIDEVLDEDFVFFSPKKVSVVRSTSPGKIRKIRSVSDQKKSIGQQQQMGHMSQGKMSKSPTPRVIINYPVKSKKVHDVGTGIRCSCQKSNEKFEKTGEKASDLDQGYYEKLMESTYGILICEDNKIKQKKQKCSEISPIFYTNKKLKILCAKCFQNHDPLLSDCLSVENVEKLGKIAQSESTDYPSETEMTWTHNGVDDDEINDDLESYSSWPKSKGQKSGQNLNGHNNMSIWTTSTMLSDSKNSTNLFPKEFTGLEYVRTWLLTNQSRLRSKNHQFYPTLDQNFHHHNHQTNPRGHSKGQTQILRSKTINSGGINTSSDFRKNVHFVPKIPKRLVGNRSCNNNTRICEPPRHKQHPTVDLNGILKTPIVINNHNNTTTSTSIVDSNSLKVAKMPTNLANKCVHCQNANEDTFYKDIEFVV